MGQVNAEILLIKPKEEVNAWIDIELFFLFRFNNMNQLSRRIRRNGTYHINTTR